MKANDPIRLALLAAVAASATMSSEARSYGSILAPRSYRYSRPRDTFNLVSDIFSMPVYMNSLMRQHDEEIGRLARSTTPRYHVSEESTGVELTMELPGVSAKDLVVELENNSLLRIKGSKKHKHHGTVYESDFDQSFQLSEDVDPEKLKVTLVSGILRVKAPKKEKVIKRLPIDTEEEEEILLEPKDATSALNDAEATVDLKAEPLEKVDDLTITDE